MIEHTCHVLRSRLDHTSETNDRIERNEPYQTLDYPSFLTENSGSTMIETRVRMESRPVLLPLISFYSNFVRNFYPFQENNTWHLFSGFGYKPLQYVYSSLDQRKILLSSYDVTKGWRKMRNSLCKSCHSDNINNIFLDQDLF